MGAVDALTLSNSTELERVRAELPSLAHSHYFNNGRFGPLPERVRRAVADDMAAEVERGRGSLPDRSIEEILDDVRARVGSLLNAPTSTIALTHNATEGVNFAVASLRWAPGEEIVTTTTEHESALAPLQVAKERFGVVVKRIEPAPDPAETVDRVVGTLSERTRMVMISHASWTNGALAPLREIAAFCRDKDVLVVGDGAQTAGAIPVDLETLDVDFYVIPGQKWLMGPSGTGALYVNPRLFGRVFPAVAGFASAADFDPDTGECIWHDNAQRFEGASDSVPLRVGFGEALRWLADDIGWEWVHRRIRDGVRRARELLSEVPGMSIVTPGDDQAGIVAFTMEGFDADEVTDHLAARGVIVRTTMPPRCVRVCIGFYTDDADLAALLAGLTSLTRPGKGGGRTG